MIGDIAGLREGKDKVAIKIGSGSNRYDDDDDDDGDGDGDGDDDKKETSRAINHKSFDRDDEGGDDDDDDDDGGIIDNSYVDGNVYIYEGAEVKIHGGSEIREPGHIEKIYKEDKEVEIATPSIEIPDWDYKEITVDDDNEWDGGFYKTDSIQRSNKDIKIASKGGPIYLKVESGIDLNNSEVLFDTKGNPVYIFVKGKMRLRNNSRFNNVKDDPRDVLVYMVSSQSERDDDDSPIRTDRSSHLSREDGDIEEEEDEDGSNYAVRIDKSYASFLLLGLDSNILVTNGSNISGSVIGNQVRVTNDSKISFPKETLGRLKDEAIIMSWEER